MIVRSFKLPKQIHGGVCLPCTVETCGKSLKKKKIQGLHGHISSRGNTQLWLSLDRGYPSWLLILVCNLVDCHSLLLGLADGAMYKGPDGLLRLALIAALFVDWLLPIMAVLIVWSWYRNEEMLQNRHHCWVDDWFWHDLNVTRCCVQTDAWMTRII